MKIEGVQDLVGAINAFIKECNDFVDKYKYAIEKTEEETPKKIKRDFELIYSHAIDAFYDSYSPNSYDRNGSLTNLFKVEAKKNTLKVTYDTDVLSGRKNVSRDYIYWITVEQGYHGGAVSGMGHPNPGVPYWRYPAKWGYPYWAEKTHPTAHTEPPRNYINAEINSYDYNKVFNDVFKKYLK